MLKSMLPSIYFTVIYCLFSIPFIKAYKNLLEAVNIHGKDVLRPFNDNYEIDPSFHEPYAASNAEIKRKKEKYIFLDTPQPVLNFQLKVRKEVRNSISCWITGEFLGVLPQNFPKNIAFAHCHHESCHENKFQSVFTKTMFPEIPNFRQFENKKMRIFIRCLDTLKDHDEKNVLSVEPISIVYTNTSETPLLNDNVLENIENQKRFKYPYLAYTFELEVLKFAATPFKLNNFGKSKKLISSQILFLRNRNQHGYYVTQEEISIFNFKPSTVSKLARSNHQFQFGRFLVDLNTTSEHFKVDAKPFDIYLVGHSGLAEMTFQFFLNDVWKQKDYQCIILLYGTLPQRNQNETIEMFLGQCKNEACSKPIHSYLLPGSIPQVSRLSDLHGASMKLQLDCSTMIDSETEVTLLEVEIPWKVYVDDDASLEDHQQQRENLFEMIRKKENQTVNSFDGSHFLVSSEVEKPGEIELSVYGAMVESSPKGFQYRLIDDTLEGMVNPSLIRELVIENQKVPLYPIFENGAPLQIIEKNKNIQYRNFIFVRAKLDPGYQGFCHFSIQFNGNPIENYYPSWILELPKSQPQVIKLSCEKEEKEGCVPLYALKYFPDYISNHPRMTAYTQSFYLFITLRFKCFSNEHLPSLLKEVILKIPSAQDLRYFN